jgi:hypothetical protein
MATPTISRAYEICSLVSGLFSMMKKLHLIKEHPLAELTPYIDFYGRIADNIYGNIQSK